MNKWLSFLWTARDRLKLAFAIIKDDRVPIWQKSIPILAIMYIFSPFNLVSFAIPLVGQIDDVFIVILAFELLERTVDDRILKEHQASLDSKVRE